MPRDRRAGGRRPASSTPYRGAARPPATRGGTLVLTVSRPGGRGTNRSAGPCRGRSGLRRAGCWLTASRGDPQDSATERKPPMAGLRARTGKGERVRQERTSGGGDPAGSVNPTRSKAKRGRRAARPVSEKGRSPGRPLRWMATQALRLSSGRGAGQNPAYRPAHRQPLRSCGPSLIWKQQPDKPMRPEPSTDPCRGTPPGGPGRAARCGAASVLPRCCCRRCRPPAC